MQAVYVIFANDPDAQRRDLYGIWKSKEPAKRKVDQLNQMNPDDRTDYTLEKWELEDQ